MLQVMNSATGIAASLLGFIGLLLEKCCSGWCRPLDVALEKGFPLPDLIFQALDHLIGQSCTPPPIEWEDLTQSRTGLFCKVVLQELSCPMKPGLNRFGIEAEQLGSFFGAHPVD